MSAVAESTFQPSLDFAEKAFANVHTRVKHLILLSDGDDAEQHGTSIEQAQRMVGEGITITVVAIGDGKDVQFLQDLAHTGKGSYYIALKAHQLQRLMTRDSSIMSRSAIEEGAFIPKVDPSDETLQGLSLNTMPPLYAYDVTSDRPLSRIPMRTKKNDPLLAFWQYGLGTSMAFTSDAQPKWARPWMGWPDFSAFWSQTVRSTLRQASNNRIQMSTRRDGGRGIVDVEAADTSGNPLNGLPLTVRVMGPAGKSADVAVRQTGPGKYEGSFEAPDPGGYIVSAVERAGRSGAPRITRAGFSIAYPPEYQAIHANTTLLGQIAQSTGGREMKTPVDAFLPIANPGTSSTELWPALLLMSAILMVVDIAVRRLALPFGEMWASFLRMFPFLTRRTSRRKRLATAMPAVDVLPGSLRPSQGNGGIFDSAPPPLTSTNKRARPGEIAGAGLGKLVPEEPRPDATDDDEPARPKRVVPVSTAEKLLAAKRSRQEQDSPPPASRTPP